MPTKNEMFELKSYMGRSAYIDKYCENRPDIWIRRYNREEKLISEKLVCEVPFDFIERIDISKEKQIYHFKLGTISYYGEWGKLKKQLRKRNNIDVVSTAHFLITSVQFLLNEIDDIIEKVE